MTVKKILIVGVLDVSTSTNVFMKKGFEKLGYRVDSYNYRTISKNLGEVELMWEDFGRFISDKKYSLIIFCKVNGMHPALLHKAKCAGPTWYWFMDNKEMSKLIGAATYAQNASFASSTASNVVERFKLLNKRSYHIVEGFDPDTYYYEDLEKIHDFVFIGNATKERVRELRRLQVMAQRRSFTIFGEGWPEGDEFNVNAPVFGEDERTEINKAKFVLNLVHDEYIFSDRVTKALGCGATVISQYSKDLDKVFGDTTFSYASYEDFSRSAECSLALFTPEQSEAMANVIAHEYSWESVCKTILTLSILDSGVK